VFWKNYMDNRITLIIRIRLIFVKSKVKDDYRDFTRITYKELDGHLYIINITSIMPKHINCRCSILPISQTDTRR
jgi:hypothetical protein